MGPAATDAIARLAPPFRKGGQGGFPIIVALTLCCLAPAPSRAEEPWLDGPFVAGAREMLEAAAKVPAPAGADVLVLLRDAAYEFDAAGRTTYRQRLVYRLLSPEGVESWALSEVDFAPWHQERPTIRARVISPRGQVHELDEALFTERPAAASEVPDVVADRRILVAPLPALEVGALVEEEILVRDTKPFFEAGTSGVYLLQMLAPVRHGRFRLEAPVSLPLRYGVRLAPDLQPRQQIAGDRVELVFEYRDTPAAGRVEVGMPSNRSRYPHVAFSTGSSWRTVATSYSRLIDDKLAASELPSATPTAGSQAERIAAILAELRREVRYTGLELGTSSVVPASPELTLERRFGDCIDQATLLVALLRREAIQAYVALLNAGFGKDVDTKLPGLGRFNHALVYVPSPTPIWIDPTDPSARAGELPAVDQSRWALIANPATEKLLRTPSSNSVDNFTLEERTVYFAEHGPGRVVEKSSYRGEQERQQRRITRTSADDGRRQGYAEYIQSTYLAEQLGEVSESDPDDLSQPFELVIEALRANRVMTDLSEAVVAIVPEGLVNNLPTVLLESRTQRQAAFLLDQPFVTEWRYRLVPPVGFVPRQLPADDERRLGAARLTRSVRQVDGEVLVDLRFDSGPRYLDPEQVVSMRRGIQELRAEEPMLLWFDHEGAAALAEGRAGDAIERFRHFADLEPAKAIHRIRLAQALLRVGLGREAQREGRRASELEPASTLAFWALGLVLEHDEAGRRFGPGFDYAAALAALEKAVSLAPENPLPRTELAILLEYDAEGRRYGDEADLDRAIEQYRILRDELGTADLDINLVSALYWARRWEELLEATGEIRGSQISDYLRLVAVAVLQGAEAAVRESSRLGTTPNDQLALLSAAAQHLVIARHYPEAGVLLRRAARNAPNAAGIVNRANLLGRMRRHEDLDLSSGTPENAPVELAKRLVFELGQPELDRARLAELFHPQYLLDRAGEEEALEGAFLRIRQEQLKAAGDLPLDAVLDLALGVLDTAVDGDPQHGYRVRMVNGMDAAKVAFRVYLTPHEGRLVIAAIEDEYGQIGREVWRRLELDDLRGAHQWLDWAREAITPADTGDPYGFQPFARYWTRGTGAFRDRMHLGAAILMCDQPEVEEALPLLEEELRETDDESVRRVIEVALLLAYNRLDDETKLAGLSARLLEKEPVSTLVFVGRSQVLLDQRRGDEVESLANARLALVPEDGEALRYLAQSAIWRRDLARADELFRRLRDAGGLRAGDYNLWAWLQLFRDPIGDEALDLALKGATQSRQNQRPMLHTLATVYAELGRPLEAHHALMQSLGAKDDPALDGDDWYVIGRIAEEYGYVELAREYYGRVAAAAAGEAFSSADLVERRLKVLSKADKKRRGP